MWVHCRTEAKQWAGRIVLTATSERRLMLLVAMALLSAGCSVIKPDPVLAGEGVKYRPFGRVASVEVIAVSKAGRKQVDVLCHDDPGTNVYHPSAFRINLIILKSVRNPDIDR